MFQTLPETPWRRCWRGSREAEREPGDHHGDAQLDHRRWRRSAEQHPTRGGDDRNDAGEQARPTWSDPADSAVPEDECGSCDDHGKVDGGRDIVALQLHDRQWSFGGEAQYAQDSGDDPTGCNDSAHGPSRASTGTASRVNATSVSSTTAAQRPAQQRPMTANSHRRGAGRSPSPRSVRLGPRSTPDRGGHYDAEHRYNRAPVTALQALAPEHVVYTGSVSKTLATALRLGWLLAPTGLRGDLVEAKRWSARVHGVSAGLHLLVSLPELDDAALAARARSHGVAVHPLSWHRQRRGPAGLVIGYAACPPDRLREAVQRLGAAAATTRGVAPRIPG